LNFTSRASPVLDSLRPPAARGSRASQKAICPFPAGPLSPVSTPEAGWPFLVGAYFALLPCPRGAPWRSVLLVLDWLTCRIREADFCLNHHTPPWGTAHGKIGEVVGDQSIGAPIDGCFQHHLIVRITSLGAPRSLAPALCDSVGSCQCCIFFSFRPSIKCMRKLVRMIESATMSTLGTVLTSAAIGVLVSSVFTLLAQYLERRSRRNELLLTKALEMAIRKSDITLEAAKLSSRNVTLVDDVISAETYLRWLKSLLRSGNLPADADKGKRKTESTQ